MFESTNLYVSREAVHHFCGQGHRIEGANHEVEPDGLTLFTGERPRVLIERVVTAARAALAEGREEFQFRVEANHQMREVQANLYEFGIFQEGQALRIPLWNEANGEICSLEQIEGVLDLQEEDGMGARRLQLLFAGLLLCVVVAEVGHRWYTGSWTYSKASADAMGQAAVTNAAMLTRP